MELESIVEQLMDLRVPGLSAEDAAFMAAVPLVQSALMMGRNDLKQFCHLIGAPLGIIIIVTEQEDDPGMGGQWRKTPR